MGLETEGAVNWKQLPYSLRYLVKAVGTGTD